MTNDSNAAAQQKPENKSSEGSAAQAAAGPETELSKVRDELLRALAEIENTRRRGERQAQDARAYAIDRFAVDLLPVADTLRRALNAAPREIADEAIKTLVAGLELTEKALQETLARHGLRQVGASGEAFDPKVHQAVAQAPSEAPAGIVIEVMQPGYLLGDRTLRAAMVVVSAGPATAAAPSVDIKV